MFLVAGLLVGLKLFGKRMFSFFVFWKREPSQPEPQPQAEPAAPSSVDEH